MKIIKFMTIFVVVLALSLNSGLSFIAKTVDSSDMYADTDVTTEDKICKNGNLTLSVNDKSGTFIINDVTSNTSWFSNPQLDDEFDENASGMTRTNMLSNLVVKYTDKLGNVDNCNSFTSAISNDDLEVKKIENGFRLLYTFAEEGFVIPLDLILKNESFEVCVNLAEIVETGDNKILSIQMVPFFCAGGPKENGYILLPDGCGALVEFDGEPQEIEYRKSVYGEDTVLYDELDEYVEKDILMPVYGIKKENSAVVAVATQGDAVSNIILDLNSSYTTATFEFNYRVLDVSVLNNSSVREKEINVTSTEKASVERFSVCYFFDIGADLNYITMAEQYRNYFLKEENINKKSTGVSLNLNYTASAQVAKSFLGIPYDGQQTLTTFSDLKQVSEILEESNRKDVVISLKDALSVGALGKVPNSAKPRRVVGNIKEYTEIKNKLNKNGSSIYIMADFQHAYKSGNGISLSFSTVRGVDGSVSKQNAYYPETYGADLSNTWYLLKASSVNKTINKFVKSLKKYNVSVGIVGMGVELYGDYNRKNNYDRQEILNNNVKALKKLKEASGELFFENANSYAFSTAGFISDLPMNSSQYDFFTCDVPFVQAVLHGTIDYSGNAINLEGDSSYSLLKNIEYGSAIQYKLICRNGDKLFESSANNLYSSSSDSWISEAVSTDEKISNFYRCVAGSKIVQHISLQKDVYETKYFNGYSTVVNYSDSEVNVYGSNIKSGDYGFFKEGELM